MNWNIKNTLVKKCMIKNDEWLLTFLFFKVNILSLNQSFSILSLRQYTRLVTSVISDK